MQFSGYYNDGYYAQLTNAPNTRIPDFTVYNSRVSFTDPGQRYELSVLPEICSMRSTTPMHLILRPTAFTEQTLGQPRWVGVEGAITLNVGIARVVGFHPSACDDVDRRLTRWENWIPGSHWLRAAPREWTSQLRGSRGGGCQVLVADINETGGRRTEAVSVRPRVSSIWT